MDIYLIYNVYEQLIHQAPNKWGGLNKEIISFNHRKINSHFYVPNVRFRRLERRVVFFFLTVGIRQSNSFRR